MADFIPDPNGAHYIEQKFFNDFPGADRNRAAQAWQQAAAHGYNDAQCYRYAAYCCGYSEDGQRLVYLTDEERKMARQLGLDEGVYAAGVVERERRRQSGN